MDDRLNYQRGRYNRVYGDSNQTIFLATPSAFLLDCVRDLPLSDRSKPQVAVDLGAGQGRNSLPLAEAGYSVTAIDLSAVGLAHLRAEAEARHLAIQTLEADAYAATYEPGSISLVVAIYFHLPDAFIDRLQAAIKPGGAIVIEGYPSDVQPGGIPLPDRFPGWQTVKYDTGAIIPDWCWGGERNPAPLIRFCARKPATP